MRTIPSVAVFGCTQVLFIFFFTIVNWNGRSQAQTDSLTHYGVYYNRHMPHSFHPDYRIIHKFCYSISVSRINYNLINLYLFIFLLLCIWSDAVNFIQCAWNVWKAICPLFHTSKVIRWWQARIVFQHETCCSQNKLCVMEKKIQYKSKLYRAAYTSQKICIFEMEETKDNNKSLFVLFFFFFTLLLLTTYHIWYFNIAASFMPDPLFELLIFGRDKAHKKFHENNIGTLSLVAGFFPIRMWMWNRQKSLLQR